MSPLNSESRGLLQAEGKSCGSSLCFIQVKKRVMRKRLSRSQSVCFVLLWVALCFIVLTSGAKIDGPLVVSLVLSAVLVGIPVWRSWK